MRLVLYMCHMGGSALFHGVEKEQHTDSAAGRGVEATHCYGKKGKEEKKPFVATAVRKGLDFEKKTKRRERIKLPKEEDVVTKEVMVEQNKLLNEGV